MIHKTKRRRPSARGRILFTTSLLSCLAVGAVAETVLDQARMAIESHPAVAGLRAQVCQATSQVDQARASIRPQATFRLNGGVSLTSNIENSEIQPRRFDDKQIDGVFSINQTIYDWGISSASVGIAENTRAAARLGVEIESERIAADILSIMISRQELVAHDAQYRDYQAKLMVLAERIEAGVEAGVNRLTDLRSIKIAMLDAEVAHTQVNRQLDLIEADLKERLNLSFGDAMPLYLDYIAARPLALPRIASDQTREVKRIDFDASSSALELKRTKAERRPSLNAIVDTTLFDVDSYSSEYEVTGRIQMNFPLYDGGSNKARQQEHIWQGRSIDHQRQDLIRNHMSQTASVLKQFDLLTENLRKVGDKIAEVELQLEEALAREGQTESQPLATAGLLTELNSLFVEQSTLEKDIELERLRGIFFADELGATLSLTYGASTC
ncbi:MAG: TolC family protein [Alphaproteobacteria bacterium]|nr:TolC family protein [Alphaproteobacteria bacterium]